MLGRKGAETSAVVAELREAVRLRPDSADFHNTLGLVLIQAGDDAAGIASLREAVRLAPDYAEARANLGAALTPTDPDAAIRELERAVALAPASLNAQFNLAVAYGASPALGVAKEIEQLRKVIALSPTFARAHLALGKALMRDGKVPDAIAELEEAARLEPKSGEAHYQLGLALARAGRKEEASAALAKGRTLVAEDDKTQNAQPRHRRRTGRVGKRRCWRKPRPSSAMPAASSRFAGPRRLHGARRRDLRRPATTRIADAAQGRVGRRSPARVGGGRSARSGSGVLQGEVRGRAPDRRVRQGTSAVLVGLVRARLQPLRAAAHRRIHQGAGQVAGARSSPTPRPTRFSAAT